MLNQQILPAISNMKLFEGFLKSSLEYCILLDMTMEQVGQLCKLAHVNHKKCLVHIDLIKGIRSDEYGALFMCQNLMVDGLISTHPPVIAVAKKKGKLAVQRIFLIDTRSLEKSIQVANNTKPDYIELLPGIAHTAFKRVASRVDTPLIGGGLLENPGDIDRCIQAGAVAVTTSDPDLWR